MLNHLADFEAERPPLFAVYTRFLAAGLVRAALEVANGLRVI